MSDALLLAAVWQDRQEDKAGRRQYSITTQSLGSGRRHDEFTSKSQQVSLPANLMYIIVIAVLSVEQ